MCSFAIASVSGEYLLRGSAAAFPPKSHDNSHINDADSTKRNGLNVVETTISADYCVIKTGKPGFVSDGSCVLFDV